MIVEILPDAIADLVAGFRFYERQAAGLGRYFLDSLFADIDLLVFNGGVHPKAFNHHRSLSKRFPFAIYYHLASDVVRVHAVLDCRKNPSWIRSRLHDND